MSIGKRVSEALEKIHAGDPEGALVPACVAVDGTAALEHPNIKANSQRYKAFLQDYAWIIGLVGLKGLVAQRIRCRRCIPI